MGSGGGGGGDPSALQRTAAPAPGLPISGKDSTIGDPFDYGKFQSFLPNAPSEGPADTATGLKAPMFDYRSPSQIMGGGGTPGNTLGGGTPAGGGVTNAGPMPPPAGGGGASRFPDPDVGRQFGTYMSGWAPGSAFPTMSAMGPVLPQMQRDELSRLIAPSITPTAPKAIHSYPLGWSPASAYTDFSGSTPSGIGTAGGGG